MRLRRLERGLQLTARWCFWTCNRIMDALLALGSHASGLAGTQNPRETSAAAPTTAGLLTRTRRTGKGGRAPDSHDCRRRALLAYLLALAKIHITYEFLHLSSYLPTNDAAFHWRAVTKEHTNLRPVCKETRATGSLFVPLANALERAGYCGHGGGLGIQLREEPGRHSSQLAKSTENSSCRHHVEAQLGRNIWQLLRLMGRPTCPKKEAEDGGRYLYLGLLALRRTLKNLQRYPASRKSIFATE